MWNSAMPFASPPLQHRDTADPWFEQWRRRQAQKEYRRFASRFTTADAYKDDPHRSLSFHEHGEERARHAGEGKALTQKKEELRDRWHLPKNADIRP